MTIFCFIFLWSQQANSEQVTFQGAFNKPGIYNINNGDKLSKIIEKAGGLADTAYPFGAVFLRKKFKNIDNLGRIIINADPAIITLYSHKDTLLEDGDFLFIPHRTNLIFITGEILTAKALPFITGQKLENYIKQSGGITKNGSINNIYILLPNGIIEKSSIAEWNYRPTHIPPGSIIYVGSKHLTKVKNNLVMAVKQYILGQDYE